MTNSAPSALLAKLERPIDTFVTLDWETFWSADFQLKKVHTDMYVRDASFQEIGIGVKVNSAPAVWMTPEQFRAWATLGPAAGGVDWARTALLCHNTTFDGFIFAEHYGIIPGFLLDTLSMARAIHGTEVGGSLAKLATHYGAGEKGHEVLNAKGKRREDFTPEEYATYGDYCKNDVELTYDIFHKMLVGPAGGAGFPEVELHIIDLTLRMFIEAKLVFDEPRLLAFRETEQKRKAELLEWVQKERADLLSNEKFAALLMERGVEPPRKLSPAALKKGEEKMTWAFAKSDPGMQELLEHENPEVRALTEARIGIKSTTNETRTERFLKAGQGGRKVPVQLKYYGAHTGRWSGTGGTNFQNLMRGGELRKSILAPPGYTLVVADLSQIEPRVTAWLSGHDHLLDVVRKNDLDGGDIYCAAGSVYFGRTITKKDNPIERQLSKTMLIGLGYGMGWLKFSGTLTAGSPSVQFNRADAVQYGVDVERFLSDPDKVLAIQEMPSRIPLEDRQVHCAVTNYFVNTYRNTNDPIVRLWRSMDKALATMLAGEEIGMGIGPGCPLRTVKNGIVLPNGLRLRYPGLQFSPGEYHPKTNRFPGYSYMGGSGGKKRTKAYGGSMTENVVQALARIVVAEHMLWLKAEYDYRPVTTSHDEVVYCVPEADGELCLERAIARMRIPPEWATGLPLNAAGDCARSYGEAK